MAGRCEEGRGTSGDNDVYLIICSLAHKIVKKRERESKKSRRAIFL